MIITCPACATRYDVPESAVSGEGRTVRCANCRHSWFQPAPDPADAIGAGEGATPLPFAPTGEPAAAVPETPASAAAMADPAPALSTGYVEADNPAFAFEPPFRPRRNRARFWLIALALIVLVAGAIAGAIAVYGAPDWLPFHRSGFAKARPGLVLDFPRDRTERRRLDDGSEFFGARGTVTNVSASRRDVPPILIVLRDQDRRVVYRWEVIPPKRQLAPGESMTINQAVTDIPANALLPEIGWKAG